jgi:hypothetical protein
MRAWDGMGMQMELKMELKYPPLGSEDAATVNLDDGREARTDCIVNGRDEKA